MEHAHVRAWVHLAAAKAPLPTVILLVFLRSIMCHQKPPNVAMMSSL
jgi:hypothetical protein